MTKAMPLVSLMTPFPSVVKPDYGRNDTSLVQASDTFVTASHRQTSRDLVEEHVSLREHVSTRSFHGLEGIYGS
jgi:hypothetical protein